MSRSTIEFIGGIGLVLSISAMILAFSSTVIGEIFFGGIRPWVGYLALSACLLALASTPLKLVGIRSRM
jgi:hypothetical protein